MTIKSNNFHFIKKRVPDLAALADLAEQYLHSDPPITAIKLRAFAEKLTQTIYRELNIILPNNTSQIELLNNEDFRDNIPGPIISKLHLIRMNGNIAAHESKCSLETAQILLKEAFELSAWMHKSFFSGSANEVPEFLIPEKPQIAEEKLKRDLLQQEIRIEKLLSELEKQRGKTKAAEKSAEEIKSARKRVNRFADELKFDEKTTRRLIIDEMLIQAGWDVGADGDPTDEVGQEVEVEHQPTKSGIGFVDYILWEDGKPLAVVEAKKTIVEPEMGQKQAKDYAEGLEKEYGFRPIIFYTNGYDIWLWNDANNEPPRKVFGYYSKDSLQYLHQKNKSKKSFRDVKLNHNIAGGVRNYQTEVITRVLESLESGNRKSLIVMATGTGKTRVAISICDALMRANRAKRILFLCDRKELRRQANNAFHDHIPDVSTVVVTRKTYKERNHRIYMATYPAMLKVYQSYDAGFFDVVIADESHRSIYNVYGELFKYFDSHQIGLTATPSDVVDKNTYKMFERKHQDPTAVYEFETAIKDNPRYLTPFEVYTHTTKFQREGIRYADLDEDGKREVENQVGDPENLDYAAKDMDRTVFNEDSNKDILRNLMEKGIKVADGSKLGKSIIFARNHKHALILQRLFYKMYSQYGGEYCKVIDSHDPRAEELLKDFKGEKSKSNINIAISVDMLDTGIDIHEIVNLVFARPVKSFIKFWQMIGRGTRLCEDLLGPGKDKKVFYIFDHWNNFEWFDEKYKPVDGAEQKSLQERLFEARIDLAETSLEKFDEDSFNLTVEIIEKDLRDLEAVNTIAVREHWKDIKVLLQEDILKQFTGQAKKALRETILPLMKWRNFDHDIYAYRFDLLMVKLQKEVLKDTSQVENFKNAVLNTVAMLKTNLNPVRAKSGPLSKIQSDKFWDDVTVLSLEEMRRELRGIMKYIEGRGGVPIEPLQLDIKEDEDAIEHKRYHPKMTSVDMAAYKNRVTEVLQSLFDQSITLQKIRDGKSISKKDIEELVSLVVAHYSDFDISLLKYAFPETTGDLEKIFHKILNSDPKFIETQFSEFIQKHGELKADQIQFLSMIKNHIVQYGGIELEKLYKPPFTLLDNQGIDGVFPREKTVDEIFQLIKSISVEHE